MTQIKEKNRCVKIKHGHEVEVGKIGCYISELDYEPLKKNFQGFQKRYENYGDIIHTRKQKVKENFEKKTMASMIKRHLFAYYQQELTER